MEKYRNQFGWSPTLGTCYNPALLKKDQCEKCDFREHVLCEKSANYQKIKKEYEKSK